MKASPEAGERVHQKTLLLLRHAKSDWDDRGLDDHERPLAARGERAASKMGALIARSAAQPDVVLCSTARRTVETLERVLSQLAQEPEVFTEEGLYLASPGRILGRVQELDPRYQSALVVSHSPGTADLAFGLCAEGDPDALRRLARKFPTAALAEIAFDTQDWADLAPGRGRLRHFVTPKELG